MSMWTEIDPKIIKCFYEMRQSAIDDILALGKCEFEVDFYKQYYLVRGQLMILDTILEHIEEREEISNEII